MEYRLPSTPGGSKYRSAGPEDKARALPLRARADREPEPTRGPLRVADVRPRLCFF